MRSATAGVAVCVLAQHVHYTIDVFVAPFVAYASWRLVSDSIWTAKRWVAKSYELRTATSLARLWAKQNERQKAHDLRGAVYDWFTEGFDTAHLKEAKALLDKLRS